MTDLHQIFDSLVGYLVGMTFVEVILKPLLVRNGQKLIRAVDQRPRFGAGLGDSGLFALGAGVGRRSQE